MKRLFLLLFPLLFAMCNSADKEKQQAIDEINELESVIYADTATTLDQLKAQEIMQNYENFAGRYENDSLAPEYLFKAGEIAMNMNMPGKSIELFQKVYTTWPEFTKRPYCLFLQGFIYENQLQQYDAAKDYYSRFVEKYPNHDLADDARSSIDNMGKSLDELIKSWETDK